MTELLERYPQLSSCKQSIDAAVAKLIECYNNNGKLLLCGNGGSCADCDHIVGELMKGFLKKRPLDKKNISEILSNSPTAEIDMLNKLQCGLPAISLPSMTAVNSAFCNDVEPKYLYAQTLFVLGNKIDSLIAISTSGNSENVVAAANLAKGLGITVIALTGKNGGKLKDIADICIAVPETETFKIQELHLPVYHYICAALEKEFFEA